MEIKCSPNYARLARSAVRRPRRSRPGHRAASALRRLPGTGSAIRSHHCGRPSRESPGSAVCTANGCSPTPRRSGLGASHSHWFLRIDTISFDPTASIQGVQSIDMLHRFPFPELSFPRRAHPRLRHHVDDRALHYRAGQFCSVAHRCTASGCPRLTLPQRASWPSTFATSSSRNGLAKTLAAPAPHRSFSM